MKLKLSYLALLTALLVLFTTACSLLPTSNTDGTTTGTTTTSAATSATTSSTADDNQNDNGWNDDITDDAGNKTTKGNAGGTTAGDVTDNTTAGGDTPASSANTTTSTTKKQTTTKPTSATEVVITLPPIPTQTTKPSSGNVTTKPTTTTTKKVTTTTTVNSKPTDRPTPLAENQLYGYKQLAAMPRATALLKAYKAITDGVANMEESISLNSAGITTDEISLVFNYYRNDHPEHFWLGTAYSYSYSGNTVLSLKPMTSKQEGAPAYLLSKSEKAQAQTKWDAAVEKYLSLINKSMSEYDRELILHDALVNDCTYNKNGGDFIHSAYGALVQKVAVCDGYSRAFAYLLRQAGIECTIAHGSSRGEGHAWNMAKINGSWYHVDITWADPVSSTPSLYHAYFNVTEERIKEDHTIDSSQNPLPAATATAENYHTKNNNNIATFDATFIGERLQNASKTTLYITGNVENFVESLTNNVYDIAVAAGRGGKFAYSLCGRELQLSLT